jgi:hypothetical protein
VASIYFPRPIHPAELKGEISSMAENDISQSGISVAPPTAPISHPTTAPISHSPLATQLAELRVLLDFLSSRPNGLAPLSSARRTKSDAGMRSVAESIDSEVQNPSLLVQRVFDIQQSLNDDHDVSKRSYSAAFLLRAKGELAERVWPATAGSIAFTNMVTTHLMDGKLDDNIMTAYVSWNYEAKRFVRTIRHLRFYVGFLSIVLILVTAAASVPFSSQGDGSFDALRVAVGICAISAFYALLGSMLSTLRAIYRNTAEGLLDVRQRSRILSNTLAGFFVGGMVGLFSISLLTGTDSHATKMLSVPAIAFLTGYFTDPILTLLDRIVALLTVFQAPRQRPPRQLNALLKVQSDIAGTVTEIHDQVERLQSNVTLDKFDGRLIIRVLDAAGVNIPIIEHTVPFEETASDSAPTIVGAQLTAGQLYQVVIDISRDVETAIDAHFQQLSTGSGDPPDLVTFNVSLDSADVSCVPKQQDIALPRDGTSAGFTTVFYPPALPGLYDIYIEVSQKGRLVAVERLSLLVTGSSPT